MLSRSFYSLALYLALPLIIGRMLWRSRQASAYRGRLPERLGFVDPAPAFGGIWVHAVSVGETIAVAPVIEALLARYPQLPITVTSTTPTGSERVRSLFGDRVHHCYVPWDTPDAVHRFLQRCRPSIAVFVETEIWPNTVMACRSRGIACVLLNARMSEKSAAAYRKMSWLSQPVLAAFDLIAAQAEADAKRFIEIGASAQAVQVCGSVKFDVALPETLIAEAAELRSEWAAFQRPIWIAASTHDGEDEAVLSAHQQLLSSHAEALLILVPRHPERFDQVAQLVDDKGLQSKRRSLGESPDDSTQVFIADSMGEMMLWFGMSDVAFIGGSLVERGGHNPLEPAVWSVPVISGPHVFNFQTIYQQLDDAGAVAWVQDDNELGRQLERWFERPDDAVGVGAAGQSVVAANRGALERQLTALANYLPAPSQQTA